MSSTSSMSIKAKFFTCIAIIPVLFILCATFFFMGFLDIDSASDNRIFATRLRAAVFRQEIADLREINTLTENIKKVMASSQAALQHNTKQESSIDLWSTPANRAHLSKIFPRMSAALADFDSIHADFRRSGNRVEDALKRGDAQAALKEYNTVTVNRVHRLHEIFVTITALADEWAGRFQKDMVAEMESLKMLFAGICVVALAMVAFFVFVFIKMILQPIAAIDKYTRDVSAGKEATLHVDSGDELGRLAKNLTTLMSNLSDQCSFATGVLDGISMPCTVFSAEDKIIFTNKQMFDLLGRDGRPEDMVNMISGEYIWGDRSKPTLSTRALREKQPVSIERSFVNFKKRNVHVKAAASPFYDKHGTLLGCLSMWADVTEIVENQKVIEENGARIASLVESAQDIANNVSSAGTELSAQVEQSNKGAFTQSNSVQEAANAMGQMNDAVVEVAESASDAARTAADAMEKAKEGSVVMAQMVESFRQLESYTGDVKTGMDSLGKQADGVGAIISVITDIADQTNLLALNAAIEAARAGDAGRGFAVVADEVRKLAEKTMQATGEVGSVITGIQRETQASVGNVERAVQSVQSAATLAIQAGENLNTIVGIAETTAMQVQSIASASEEQSVTSGMVNDILENVRTTSEETANAMQEAAVAVEILAKQALTLNELIESMQTTS